MQDISNGRLLTFKIKTNCSDNDDDDDDDGDDDDDENAEYENEHNIMSRVIKMTLMVKQVMMKARWWVDVSVD